MKKFFTDFSLGLSSYAKAWKLIRTHNMWGYFLLPVVISLVMAVTFFLARMEIHHFIESTLLAYLNYENWWEWLQQLTSWILHIAIFVLTWYLYIKFQKYILFIFLSPVLAFLSDKTAEKLGGDKTQLSVAQFVKDLIRGFLLAIRNFCLEMGLTLLLFLLGLIPVLSPFTFILTLIVGWYYYGYTLMDYTNERNQLSISESSTIIRSKRGAAIANGLIFELLFMIPILGFIVAPVLGTVSATIAMESEIVKSKKEISQES